MVLRRIQSQALVIFVLATFILLGLIYFVFTQYMTLKDNTHRIEQQTFLIEELVYQTQKEFKEQVAQWQLLLLRGHDPEYYEKYLRLFTLHEAYARSHANRLIKLLDEIPEARQILMNFLSAHQAAGKQYRSALDWFNLDGENRHIAADLRASGLESVPTSLLDDVVRLAELHRQQVLQAIEQEQEKFQQYSLFLIAVIISLVALAVMALLRFMVIKPIDYISSLAHQIASGDFTTIRQPPAAFGQSMELIDALMNMQQQLQEYDSKAKDERERLETAVKLRTVELEKAHMQAVNEAISAVRAKEEADEANESKSRFLANISHELRTPLHAILSFSGIGLNKTQEAHSSKCFKRIEASGHRLLDLIDQLLNLAQLESGKVQPVFSRSSLKALVNDCLVQLESLLEMHDMQVKLVSEDNHLACFDRKMIMQVVINLISNAIKFSPRSSLLQIELRSNLAEPTSGQPSFVTFSIIDEGIGIPENELTQVFDSFYQSSKTRDKGNGTGLGLPIAREIILDHGGQIWAESPPQGKLRGTSFTFHIPVAQPKPSADLDDSN